MNKKLLRVIEVEPLVVVHELPPRLTFLSKHKQTFEHDLSTAQGALMEPEVTQQKQSGDVMTRATS